MKKEKIDALPAFGKTGKMGTYTLILSIIVLAVIVFVNMVVGALPSRVTKPDISPSGMYTLSSTTVDYVSGITDDVTLYYICAGGTENAEMRTFLDRYADLSSRIRVKTVDPISDPAFLEEYGAEDASNYSVVVAGEKRSKVADYADMYYYYNESTGKMTPEEYSQTVQYMSYYGVTFESYYGPVSEYFGGDSLITSAIEYATAPHVPTVYLLEGHGEQELTDTVRLNLFDYSGVTYSSLNIALGDIPEDADVILINTPANDLSADEAARLTAYFRDGGNLLLITAVGCDTFENLRTLTAAMGMEAVGGTVSEGDSRMYYSRAPQYIYPNVDSAHASLSLFRTYADTYGATALVPYAHAIQTRNAEGVTVTPLLTTSDKAKIGDSEETGVCTLAAAAEAAGKFVWVGSSQMLTDTFVNGTNGANFYLIASLFQWMQGNFASALPEIAGVELSEPTITVTTADVNLWGAILIFAVPLLVMGGGLAYWIYRRKK